MRLSRALQEKLMDTRLRDKLLAEGKITKKEVNEFLNSLKDESSNMDHIDLEDSSKAKYPVD